MNYFVTKEQVKQVLEHHGHHIVMDSAFITGAPMSELEAIVDVCDVVAKAAYDQGVKDATPKRCEICGYAENEREHTGCLRVKVKDLEKQIEELREANKDLANAAIKPDVNESEELEKAIETIQAALSGSFRDNLKLEVTEQHAWLVYGNLKFLIEPMEAWQAVQSCVYLSELEVDND